MTAPITGSVLAQPVSDCCDKRGEMKGPRGVLSFCWVCYESSKSYLEVGQMCIINLVFLWRWGVCRMCSRVKCIIFFTWSVGGHSRVCWSVCFLQRIKV